MKLSAGGGSSSGGQVPEPTWCPECRLIRRMTFRNDRSLYQRACDKCGQDKIFMYPADAPFPVYCYACWWGDDWDAKEYAREYDFSKPFFDQFLELRNAVPRCGVVKQGFSVNSEYTNRVTDMKNCYLIFPETAWIALLPKNQNDAMSVSTCFRAQMSCTARSRKNARIPATYLTVATARTVLDA